MFASIIIAAVALPLFASAVPDNCARMYTVVEGDTCDAISAAHNSSTYQLATVNNPDINEGCTNLAIGQQICLGTTGEDCTTTYIVKPDDTCDGITQNISVNSTILYANNPTINADCSNLYVGQVLCSLGEVRVPPAPAGRPTSSVVPLPGTATAAPAPTASQTPAGDDDIPECEDPEDDGEW